MHDQFPKSHDHRRHYYSTYVGRISPLRKTITTNGGTYTQNNCVSSNTIALFNRHAELTGAIDDFFLALHLLMVLPQVVVDLPRIMLREEPDLCV